MGESGSEGKSLGGVGGRETATGMYHMREE